MSLLLGGAVAEAQTAPTAETWRVLVLRVDFPWEAPDEPTTSGRGRFDLRTLAAALPDYQLPFDTPPHDRAFYERHMAALARYYDVVSEGRVAIEAQVFPRADTLAYTLPRSALSYGNGRSPEEIGRQWRDLAVDAVALAAADPDGPRFADFDSYLIVHAGLGHETGQLNDVRSVYLGPADLADSGGVIAADGGLVAIDNLWILPEAVDDRGRAGLNGLLAKFFGHQLGLPGLSNFADGLPAVGGWSLMDVGANRIGFLLQGERLDYVFGVVPPHPLAWSKARLGWIEPLTVTRDTTVTVVAGDRSPVPGSTAARAVRVPLSPTEYLLLENRQQRGRTELELPTGVESPFDAMELTWVTPAQVDIADTVSAADSDSLAGLAAGVWMGADEYDAFVPGSGILVWHVDDAVIAAAPEGFNNDRERPGLALVEADGYRDIGNYYFDRQDLTEGTRSDPFFTGSPAPGLQGVFQLGPDTTPATRTYTGLDAGVEVEVLSPPGDSMRVRLHFRRAATGWPRPLAGVDGLRVLDLGGGPAVVATTPTRTVVYGDAAAGAAGETVLEGRWLAASPTDVFTARVGGVEAHIDLASQPLWTAEWTGAPATALYAANLSGAGGSLVVGGAAGVAAWDAADGTPRFVDPRATTGLAAADLDGDGDDDLVAVGPDGAYRYDGATAMSLATGTFLQAPALGDVDADGTADAILVDAAGRLTSVGQDRDLAVDLGAAPVGPPSLADLDGDGRLEIVVATAERLHVLTGGGLRASGFPVAPPTDHEAGDLRGEAIGADLDGDGGHELLVAAGIGVYAWGADGTLLSGFPAPTPQAPVGAPIAVDSDGDGALEIGVATGQAVYLWRPASWDGGFATGGQGGWTQAGGNAAGARGLAVVGGGPGPLTGDLLPASRAYCYPNPVNAADPEARVRYFVAREARVELQVYDAVGQRVEHVGAPVVRPGEENEIAWSTAGYASGLYLCRLRASGSDGSRGDVTLRLAVSR